MARIGRPPTCICGSCRKCKHRIRAREKWQSLSLDERREIIARRDKEKVRATDRARYYRHRPQRQERMREWAAKNVERAQAAKNAWATRNKEKRQAHYAVSNAIRAGKIVRGNCEVCAAPNAQAHHDDYSKPLEVRWLCTTHHGEHHRRYDDGIAA